ncbi:MAG: hypothetical protein SOV54_01375 [Faecalibacterium prausnitzii]|nr:hypothetical protein [Faecalibacterium prausnitzii]
MTSEIQFSFVSGEDLRIFPTYFFSDRGRSGRQAASGILPCGAVSDLFPAFLSKLCFLRNVPVKNS